MSTFVLSIETDAGTYMHGYHLGTIESVARSCAEEAFKKMRPKIGTYIVSVALKHADGFFDVYDGQWSSEYESQADYVAFMRGMDV
jgi:hypothetical protein